MLSRTAFRSAAQLSSRHPAFTLVRAAAGIQYRAAASAAATNSASTSKDEAYSLLVEQRKKRPVSPHLSIYQPQLTWYMSMLNRITGSVLSGGIYIFGATYAVSPLFGWHLETATMAAAFGGLPLAAKLGIKGMIALPFTYHSWNGIRHLMWDATKGLDLKNVYRTGYMVMGLTAISTVALVMV